MAVYIVHGKLGTGKTKYCVWKMREAMKAGKLVCTNLDLNMEHLMPADSKFVPIRLPDKPKSTDLLALPHGNPDSYDEERNGVMVLDELGSWLNARQFADKDRAAVLDWLIHARKHGWDLYLIVQNVDMIDKQVRLGLAEYLVKCIRADKIRIPVIGQMLGPKWGRLPRFHMANISMADVPGMVLDRDTFRGDDLHAAYDTRQIFKEDSCGMHSVLSAWHLAGRHAVANAHKTRLQALPPKNDITRWIQRLPAERRIPFMRAHGLLGG